MACCAKLRWGSFVLLALAFASWVIALGGLGAINWLVCSDTANTATSIATDADNIAQDLGSRAKMNVPPASTDVALCARSWRWEWWALFFEFAIITSGLVATAIPGRIARARFPLANMLAIASVLIMVALNENITDVWFFWDQHKLFAEWKGVLQKLYFSAAALVAGWILVVIFNLIWIGFALDAEVQPEDKPAPPITNDVEAGAARK